MATCIFVTEPASSSAGGWAAEALSSPSHPATAAFPTFPLPGLAVLQGERKTLKQRLIGAPLLFSSQLSLPHNHFSPPLSLKLRDSSESYIVPSSFPALR